MNIIALDPGTRTGVACGPAGQIPHVETWALRADDKESVGALFGDFTYRLEKLITAAHPAIVVFEAPFLGPKLAANMHTARRVIGFPCMVELVAHRLGVTVFEASLMTVRAQFGCGGRAGKADVIAMARRRGFTVSNDHEADACAVFYHAVAMKFPEHLGAYDPLFQRRAIA